VSPYLTECVCCIYMLENFVSQHIRVLGDCVSPDMRVFEILCVTISHSMCVYRTLLCLTVYVLSIFVGDTLSVACVAVCCSVLQCVAVCCSIYMLITFVGDTVCHGEYVPQYVCVFEILCLSQYIYVYLTTTFQDISKRDL